MKRTNERDSQGEIVCRKKPRFSKESLDLFGTLPDDIVMVIFGKLSSSARSPQDFINVLLTCTRLKRLALEPAVLKVAGMFTVAVPFKKWSEYAHQFIMKCVLAGSIEAIYFLGMIRFHAMDCPIIGKKLLKLAATKNNAAALHSLAIINFNGSGGSRNSKDVRAAISLWARAVELDHIDSFRELGICLQEGYGVKKNLKKARTYLSLAAAKEVKCAIRAGITNVKRDSGSNPGSGQDLWTHYGLPFLPRETHPVNRFLVEWFGKRGFKPGSSSKLGWFLKVYLCSDSNCGRLETRVNEFMKCSMCQKARYCSRGCQAQDWMVRHQFECLPEPQQEHDAVDQDL